MDHLISWTEILIETFLEICTKIIFIILCLYLELLVILIMDAITTINKLEFTIDDNLELA